MPDDVVEQPPVETVQEKGEETVAETPVEEKPDTTPPTDSTEHKEDEPHPLEPGGERFKQVYARAKDAEERLHREREERIRLEERTKALEEQQKAKPTEKVYSWDELEGFITDGRISRAQAQNYREQVVAKQAEEKARGEIERILTTHTVQSRVLNDIEAYKVAIPEVNTPGSADHNKVYTAYHDIVSTFGVPRTDVDQLKYQREALIRVYGEPGQLKTRTTTTRKVEPMLDTSSNHKPSPQKGKDPVDNLDTRQRKHYERMIERGVYSGWSEVREELQWDPSKRKVKRG